ncbi:hypothetical protein PUN28_018854 [Cardiocondyla obscurior]|uniref:Ribosomal protein L23 n=1 Tax=Cardiocondyla obscurior TaxID=286306 RepID=A0AAW2EHT5_9HYME
MNREYEVLQVRLPISYLAHVENTFLYFSVYEIGRTVNARVVSIARKLCISYVFVQALQTFRWKRARAVRLRGTQRQVTIFQKGQRSAAG